MLRKAGSGSIPAAIALGCALAFAGCATQQAPVGPEGATPAPAGPHEAAAALPDDPVEPLALTAAIGPPWEAPPAEPAVEATATEPTAGAAATAPAASDAEALFEDGDSYEPPAPPSDPLEPANRVFFTFNQKLDRWFWQPLTDAYRFVTPEPARRCVRRALHNLNSPVFFVNDVLQLRFRDAAETLGSFALNSTLGMLGLFEPSREAGWEAREADFGQTLALVGIGSGAYVVVPILGPTTVRDGLGSAVDRFFQPLTYVLGFGTQILWGGGAGLSTREEFSDELAELERSSVDFYSAMRSVYLQNRDGEIEVARQRRAADLGFLIPALGPDPGQAATLDPARDPIPTPEPFPDPIE